MQPVIAKIKTNKLYIEPVSHCMLKCEMCYTEPTHSIQPKVLADNTVSDFISEFIKYNNGPIEIYWCGTGEISIWALCLVDIINSFYISGSNIKHIIQTNGLSKGLLEPFKCILSDNVHYQFSIDGLKLTHEMNRGKNTYDPTILNLQEFVRHKDFLTEPASITVRSLIHRENVYHMDEFYDEIKKISSDINISFTLPFDNSVFEKLYNNQPNKRISDNLNITSLEIEKILKESNSKFYNELFPEESISTEHYLSLRYDGIFNCCECKVKIGGLSEDLNINELLNNLRTSLSHCKECPLYSYCF